MRVMAIGLAVCGCSMLPVSAVIRAPVDDQCQARGLKGCPELVDGALAYVDGKKALAREKLEVARSKNSPEQLVEFAGALRQIASASNAAQPLADVADLLAPTASATRAAAGAPIDEKAQVALPNDEKGSPPPRAAARSSAVEERKANAQRLALYALSARDDLTRRVSETIEVVEGGASPTCKVAGSDARCLRRHEGPVIVTDVIASEECGQRILLAASDEDSTAPAFGFAWLLPARSQGVHGASFALKGGQWLYLAVRPPAKPSSTMARGCFVTWSGFRPRLVPSLAEESEDYTVNPYRLRDWPHPAIRSELPARLAPL